MVRREEQPWESRAMLLLDTRAAAHRGEGPASSFEAAVSAAASIGVHLGRGGFSVAPGHRHRDPAGRRGQAEDPTAAQEDLLLDGLAVVETVAQRRRCDRPRPPCGTPATASPWRCSGR